MKNMQPDEEMRYQLARQHVSPRLFHRPEIKIDGAKATLD
jgi:hypothetical protein